MNQRPQGLNVSKAVSGFLQYKSAEGLATVTVSGYERDLKLWIEYQGDMDIYEIGSSHILSFLNYLRTEYVPRRITGGNFRKLAPKTVYNLYVSVVSFFTWATREFNLSNPMKNIPARQPDGQPGVGPELRIGFERLRGAVEWMDYQSAPGSPVRPGNRNLDCIPMEQQRHRELVRRPADKPQQAQGLEPKAEKELPVQIKTGF